MQQPLTPPLDGSPTDASPALTTPPRSRPLRPFKLSPAPKRFTSRRRAAQEAEARSEAGDSPSTSSSPSLSSASSSEAPSTIKVVNASDQSSIAAPHTPYPPRNHSLDSPSLWRISAILEEADAVIAEAATFHFDDDPDRTPPAAAASAKVTSPTSRFTERFSLPSLPESPVALRKSLRWPYLGSQELSCVAEEKRRRSSDYALDVSASRRNSSSALSPAVHRLGRVRSSSTLGSIRSSIATCGAHDESGDSHQQDPCLEPASSRTAFLAPTPHRAHPHASLSPAQPSSQLNPSASGSQRQSQQASLPESPRPSEYSHTSFAAPTSALSTEPETSATPVSAARRTSDEITVYLDSATGTRSFNASATSANQSSLRRRAVSGATTPGIRSSSSFRSDRRYQSARPRSSTNRPHHLVLSFPPLTPVSPRTVRSSSSQRRGSGSERENSLGRVHASGGPLGLPSPRDDQPLSQTLRELGAHRTNVAFRHPHTASQVGSSNGTTSSHWTDSWRQLKQEEERRQYEIHHTATNALGLQWPLSTSLQSPSSPSFATYGLPVETIAGFHHRNSNFTAVTSTTRAGRSVLGGRNISTRFSRFVKHAWAGNTGANRFKSTELPSNQFTKVGLQRLTHVTGQADVAATSATQVHRELTPDGFGGLQYHPSWFPSNSSGPLLSADSSIRIRRRRSSSAASAISPRSIPTRSSTRPPLQSKFSNSTTAFLPQRLRKSQARPRSLYTKLFLAAAAIFCGLCFINIVVLDAKLLPLSFNDVHRGLQQLASLSLSTSPSNAAGSNTATREAASSVAIATSPASLDSAMPTSTVTASLDSNESRQVAASFLSSYFTGLAKGSSLAQQPSSATPTMSPGTISSLSISPAVASAVQQAGFDVSRPL